MTISSAAKICRGRLKRSEDDEVDLWYYSIFLKVQTADEA